MDRKQRDQQNEICVPEDLIDCSDLNVTKYLSHWKINGVGREFEVTMRLAFDKIVIGAVTTLDYRYD